MNYLYSRTSLLALALSLFLSPAHADEALLQSIQGAFGDKELSSFLALEAKRADPSSPNYLQQLEQVLNRAIDEAGIEDDTLISLAALSMQLLGNDPQAITRVAQKLLSAAALTESQFVTRLVTTLIEPALDLDFDLANSVADGLAQTANTIEKTTGNTWIVPTVYAALEDYGWLISTDKPFAEEPELDNPVDPSPEPPPTPVSPS